MKGNTLTEVLGIGGVTGINCLDCLIANSSSLCVLTDNYKEKNKIQSLIRSATRVDYVTKIAHRKLNNVTKIMHGKPAQLPGG